MAKLYYISDDGSDVNSLYIDTRNLTKKEITKTCGKICGSVELKTDADLSEWPVDQLLSDS